MKWIFLSLLFLFALPFIIKSIYILYILYRQYFALAVNSKYPIHFKQLSFLFRRSSSEREERKPIGFDTSFTEEDKLKLKTVRAAQKRS